ncbi:hypothetical protein TRVL_03851 [Trypanosoma vivax]|nr:hypothetical protein TRVL_03851 [Trypanosoma vivax]
MCGLHLPFPSLAGRSRAKGAGPSSPETSGSTARSPTVDAERCYSLIRPRLTEPSPHLRHEGCCPPQLHLRAPKPPLANPVRRHVTDPNRRQPPTFRRFALDPLEELQVANPSHCRPESARPFVDAAPFSAARSCRNDAALAHPVLTVVSAGPSSPSMSLMACACR